MAMALKLTFPSARSTNFLITGTASCRSVAAEVVPWRTGVPFRPSSSYKPPSTCTSATKCRLTSSSAVGHAVSPAATAPACAVSMPSSDSKYAARSSGSMFLVRAKNSEK